MNFGLVCIKSNQSQKKGFSGLKALNACPDPVPKLLSAALYNLEQAYNNILFCKAHDIASYRISSGIIPYSEYWNYMQFSEVTEWFDRIKKLNHTLTIHPDQFTVINSFNHNIVRKSTNILNHHHQLCNLMGISHIILHTGGVYGNKEEAMLSFVMNFSQLNSDLQDLIRLENCHSFDITDVLLIQDLLDGALDVCFDLHHERVIHGKQSHSQLRTKLSAVVNCNYHTTIVHISSGDNKSHADYISDEDEELFLPLLCEFNCIVEVEAKAKELAIFKLRGK